MGMKIFDMKLKRTLENRRIDPSASSWEKLSYQLDQEKPPANKRFWWLGIAAVFLGALLVGSLIFDTGKTTFPKKQRIVEEPSKKDIQMEEYTPTLSKPVEVETKIAPLQETVVVIENKRENIHNKSKKSLEIVQVNKREEVEIEKESAFIEEEATKIFNSLVKGKKNHEVTDVEIEALLRDAKLEISKQDLIQVAENQMSAHALLKNVEQELKQSRQKRIFKIVEAKLIQLASTSSIFN